jgi:predicted extracellular nuclease
VVTADFDDSSQKGFFLQTENCDQNPATSDGIFVYLGERVDAVNVGDLVEVKGTVHEYYGLTEISASPSNIELISQGNPLPTAVELVPPFDNDQARAYFESLEGMLVTLEDARAVGPTDGRSDTWVIRNDLGLERVFQDDAFGTGEIICLGAEGHYKIDPPAKVGDRIQGVQGVLSFSLGTYRLSLLAQPTQIPESTPLLSVEESTEPAFTFGTFNLNNLFDTLDDPAKDDDVLSGTEYHRKLEKLALTLHAGLGEPDFVAVQEVENATVLAHLAARSEIEADYVPLWLEGPDQRGIDVALLYRPDRVSVRTYEQHQGCTTLADGLGPDGNRDMQNPQNAITCDTDGDNTPDGNRLFSRPPLAVHLEMHLNDTETLPLWVIINHWKSKREDTDYVAYTQARRVAQAQFVAALAKEIVASHPGEGLIVIGDLNDYADSQPLSALHSAGLWNAMDGVARDARYTYIYQGVSQVLDYVLLNTPLAIQWVRVQPVHLNADYPYAYQAQSGMAYRSSDHDPVRVEVAFLQHHIYLPVIRR